MTTSTMAEINNSNDQVRLSTKPAAPMLEDLEGLPKDSCCVLTDRRGFKARDLQSSQSTLDETESTTSTESWEGSDSSFFVSEPSRVQFLVNEDDEPLVTYFPAQPAELTEEEIHNLWYTREEFVTFRKFSKKLASMAFNSSYLQELGNVFGACCDESTPSQSMTKFSRIANSAARGLELSIHPSIMERRRATIRSVLSAQSSIRAQQRTRTITREQRQKLLASTCKSYSRPARLFARILGNGDAAIAKALNPRA